MGSVQQNDGAADDGIGGVLAVDGQLAQNGRKLVTNYQSLNLHLEVGIRQNCQHFWSQRKQDHNKAAMPSDFALTIILMLVVA